MNHVLFLDIDRVINQDFGYIYIKKYIIFNKGIFELVRKAKKFKDNNGKIDRLTDVIKELSI